MTSLEPEARGAAPRLLPGDVVRVGKHIGVVVKVSFCGWQWDDVPPLEHNGTIPSYAVQFRSEAKLKHAWWWITELDEVVSLGPFHEKES